MLVLCRLTELDVFFFLSNCLKIFFFLCKYVNDELEILFVISLDKNGMERFLSRADL